ncbi:MAG: hypothetical protein HOW73_23960 [Polyangiaceae bacterium]|nr:hypothetical protein [Polyangiaceae bacterium]
MQTLEALPAPFAAPADPAGVKTTPEVLALVRAQVKELLHSSPAYARMNKDDQRDLAHNLVKIASYNASLVRDQWVQSKRLDQVPVLRTVDEDPSAVAAAAPVRASAEAPKGPAADEFATRATGSAGRITKETLNAIAFPTFVADLIKGTFNAIVDASIQQMEAYGKLLANVAKTVDQFMSENITDNQARDFLTSSYPEHFKLEIQEGQARVKARETETDPPDFKSLLDMPENVSVNDDSAEQKFVPAARRKLAQSRLQMLSTMVLMGINRIVITSGRIRATMGFHLQAEDKANAESASQFDFKHENEFGAGGGLVGSIFGSPTFKARTSVAYVSTQKRGSSDEIKMDTDLTAEVDLKFKSDYFPLERFAKTGVIAQIQQHTANPTANAPASQSTDAGARSAQGG